MKKLLIVTHAPSDNTLSLRKAVIEGAQHPDISEVEISAIAPLDATAEDVISDFDDDMFVQNQQMRIDPNGAPIWDARFTMTIEML